MVRRLLAERKRKLDLSAEGKLEAEQHRLVVRRYFGMVSKEFNDQDRRCLVQVQRRRLLGEVNDSFRTFNCGHSICQNCFIDYLLHSCPMIIYPDKIINCIIPDCNSIQYVDGENVIQFIHGTNGRYHLWGIKT